MIFTYRRVGTEGCEILGPTGEVVAWTMNEAWAGFFTGLANLVEWTSPPQPLAVAGMTPLFIEIPDEGLGRPTT